MNQAWSALSPLSSRRQSPWLRRRATHRGPRRRGMCHFQRPVPCPGVHAYVQEMVQPRPGRAEIRFATSAQGVQVRDTGPVFVRGDVQIVQWLSTPDSRRKMIRLARGLPPLWFRPRPDAEVPTRLKTGWPWISGVVVKGKAVSGDGAHPSCNLWLRCNCGGDQAAAFLSRRKYCTRSSSRQCAQAGAVWAPPVRNPALQGLPPGAGQQ